MYPVFELIEELTTASSLLQDALRRYIGACSTIQNYYAQNTSLADVPRAFLDYIEREFTAVALHEETIKQAKSIIGQARNCSALTPINSLPSEILTHVFHLVIFAAYNNTKSKKLTDTSFPTQPDLLSHVCSRWRRILLDMPSIWSRIDLAYFHPLSPAFVARAEACVVRSGNLPLDVQLRTPASHSITSWGVPHGFMESIMARARSVELVIPTTAANFTDMEYVYESCFNNCKPGILTELTINDLGQYTPDFIISADRIEDDGFEPEGYYLGISEEVFEDILRSVTKLCLNGLYPCWVSQAYWGLVELRLTCQSKRQFFITNPDLYGILEQSPKLRLLEFGIDITSDIQIPDNCPPASLEDLEILNLGSLEFSQLNLFFRVLAPASKPLQLTLTHDPRFTQRERAVHQFLMHSHIVKLRISTVERWSQVNELLDMLPHLRVLALEHISCPEMENLRFGDNKLEIRTLATKTAFRLDALHMLEGECNLYNICDVAEKIPVQAIKLWRCIVYRDRTSVPREEVSAELLKSGSIVENLAYERDNPVEDWGWSI